MKHYKGGLIDNRKEKKDFSHLEVGRSSVPTYLTRSKALKVTKKYEVRDQKSTSSCGSHAAELAHSIDTEEMHEPAFIYRHRANFPGEGMWHFDIGDILVKMGANLNKNIEKTEVSYNAYKPTPKDLQEALQYKQSSYIVLENDKFTIDDIAYIVNDLKRPLILFVYWNGKEWNTDFPVAKGDLTPQTAQYRHYVTVLPNSAYTYKKQKYVIIQDSAHFGKKHIRHLSEDWVNKRIYTGLYFTEMVKEDSPSLPNIFKKNGIDIKFEKDLKFGDVGIDVELLQQVLKLFGFFPRNIEPTGYYGGITRQAVKDFQKAHEKSILWTIGLKKPTGYFGPSTRKVINQLISDN
jgi:hypothetical protein